MPLPIDKILDGARLWAEFLDASDSAEEAALEAWAVFRDNLTTTPEDAAWSRAIGHLIWRHQQGIDPPAA